MTDADPTPSRNEMPNSAFPLQPILHSSLIIILPVAILHTVLLSIFPESIEITVRDEIPIYNDEWRGIDVLFILLGAACGWFSPILIERKWEGRATALIVIAAIWSLAATGLGLLFAFLIRGQLPIGSWIMAVYSLFGAAIGLTAWYVKES